MYEQLQTARLNPTGTEKWPDRCIPLLGPRLLQRSWAAGDLDLEDLEQGITSYPRFLRGAGAELSLSRTVSAAR